MTDDIDLLIVTTLKADATLKTLMGITPDDPRVYKYYQGSAVIDPQRGKRGYITYMNLADDERVSAVGGPVYSLAIWADSFETAHQIRARVLALLNYEGELEDTLTGASGRAYQPVKIAGRDSAQENTKFAGISLHFRFGYSHV